MTFDIKNDVLSLGNCCGYSGIAGVLIGEEELRSAVAAEGKRISEKYKGDRKSVV